MPYAQLHYPSENQEKFEQSFPAEFIAEGVDQTRAWFYYLHIIASAIKKNVAFKNVVVNGIVLAEDGKKMSKKLQNYPDPTLMFDKYGADVMRFYLLTSPVMSAENLNFKESDMAEISRGMFRMLWNSYSFFVLYANIDKWGANNKTEPSANILDKWILSELNELLLDVDRTMTNYELTKAMRLFPKFVDNLSNWYIRRSRKRFWKSENDKDKAAAYSTLHTVLVELSKAMAPFTPFLAEEIFKNLTGRQSVHLEDYPQGSKSTIDLNLNEEMIAARRIVEMGLSARADAGIKVRQPLNTLSYGERDGVKELTKELEEIIADEVNVKKVIYDGKVSGVMIDFHITEELKIEGLGRELVRNIQALRKDSGFNVSDRIIVDYQTDSKELDRAMNLGFVAKEILAKEISQKLKFTGGMKEYAIGDQTISIELQRVE
jgi:isoleucyl-tRNA synthetase